MRVYLDTNIVMEYFGHRLFHDDVSMILKAAEQKGLEACISLNSLDTIIYLLGNQLKDKGVHGPEKRQKICSMICELLAYVDVVGISRDNIMKAMKDDSFKDLEDSIQYHCALENSSDSLVTINIKDFKKAKESLEVLSPSDFVLKYMTTLSNPM